MAALAAAFALVGAAECRADHTLEEFPRLEGETDDAARIQRAVDACPSGVLSIGSGVYEIARMVNVTNLCSIELNKSAILRAVAEMPFVLRVNNEPVLGNWNALPLRADRRQDYGMFVTGGRIDGNGLASCMMLDGFQHYTLRDVSFLNGRKYGLAVDAEEGTGYELVAENLYFKCFLPGLAGNTAFFLNGGDCHVTDCISVDYTVGFHLARGGSNRLTRCHVWGGPIPPPRKGEPCEMLKDSVCFKVASASCILRDCYADTGKIGFEIDAYDTRLLGCSYFNNRVFHLDDITVIRHLSGRLLVADGAVVKTAPHLKVYEGCGLVKWHNMMYSGFGPDDDTPGAADFGEQTAPKELQLAL